ncbi:unnamed protein product [Linum trigynum]|uniref:Uncharacterized protein n=1 Tax=Linum trigynum TaxID=586398 RepID=A0AAV2EVX8_9ROSI
MEMEITTENKVCELKEKIDASEAQDRGREFGSFVRERREEANRGETESFHSPITTKVHIDREEVRGHTS